SVTDSGMGFGLHQMISERRYQPSACSANATRHGMPTRSLDLRPCSRWTGFMRCVAKVHAADCKREASGRPSRRNPLDDAGPPLPFVVLAYESPRLSHSVA